MAKTEGFQARAADGLTVVELGPRYLSKTYDRTTVLRVFHRTIGGGVSFLLEREQFAQLRVWLDGDHLAELRFETHDHFARLRQTFPGSIAVSAGWLSASGGKRTGTLGPEDAAALTAWVADKDDHGWSGWKELPAGAVCRCSADCADGAVCSANGTRHMHGQQHVSCPVHRGAYTMKDPAQS